MKYQLEFYKLLFQQGFYQSTRFNSCSTWSISVFFVAGIIYQQLTWKIFAHSTKSNTKTLHRSTVRQSRIFCYVLELNKSSDGNTGGTMCYCNSGSMGICGIQIQVDISHILGNLITVIFNYQILRKPLKILSL